MSRFSNKAFSIIEILMGLALIALIAGLFALNFDTLLTSFAEKHPEKLIYEAIRKARYHASFHASPVHLRFDEKSHKLLIERGLSAKVIDEIPLQDYVQLRFHDSEIKRFRFGRFMEDKNFRDIQLPRITFMPDGSSNAAIITLKEDNDETLLLLDPLSLGIRLKDPKSL